MYDNDLLDLATAVPVSAGGTMLGSFDYDEFTADLSITDLADGRFAVVCELPDGEIKMEILDTRDTTHDRGVYTPNSWQTSTVFDDNIATAASFAHGHSGNNTITDSGTQECSFGRFRG